MQFVTVLLVLAASAVLVHAQQRVPPGNANKNLGRVQDPQGCPKICRFYKLKTGQCRDSTCPVTCAEDLYEASNARRRGEYDITNWSTNQAWSQAIRSLVQEQARPHLGVAATCEYLGTQKYRCSNRSFAAPAKMSSRQDQVAYKETCVCNVRCTNNQVATSGMSECPCSGRKF